MKLHTLTLLTLIGLIHLTSIVSAQGTAREATLCNTDEEGAIKQIYDGAAAGNTLMLQMLCKSPTEAIVRDTKQDASSYTWTCTMGNTVQQCRTAKSATTPDTVTPADTSTTQLADMTRQIMRQQASSIKENRTKLPTYEGAGQGASFVIYRSPSVSTGVGVMSSLKHAVSSLQTVYITRDGLLSTTPDPDVIASFNAPADDALYVSGAVTIIGLQDPQINQQNFRVVTANDQGRLVLTKVLPSHAADGLIQAELWRRSTLRPSQITYTSGTVAVGTEPLANRSLTISGSMMLGTPAAGRMILGSGSVSGSVISLFAQDGNLIMNAATGQPLSINRDAAATTLIMGADGTNIEEMGLRPDGTITMPQLRVRGVGAIPFSPSRYAFSMLGLDGSGRVRQYTVAEVLSRLTSGYNDNDWTIVNATTIHSSGRNVGIGITNPTATLDIGMTISYTTGGAGRGKILVSDAQGTARRASTTCAGGQVFNGIDAAGNVKCRASCGGTGGQCSAVAPVVYPGACGTAARAYAAADPSYGIYTLCATGTVSPASPAFPAAGGTGTWSCQGTGGGATVSCTATRAAAPVNGQCGYNGYGGSPKSYYYNDTAYPYVGSVTPGFCLQGILSHNYEGNNSSNPNAIPFPGIGFTNSRQCVGIGGGTTTSCSALRMADPNGGGGGITPPPVGDCFCGDPRPGYQKCGAPAGATYSCSSQIQSSVFDPVTELTRVNRTCTQSETSVVYPCQNSH